MNLILNYIVFLNNCIKLGCLNININVHSKPNVGGINTFYFKMSILNQMLLENRFEKLYFFIFGWLNNYKNA